MIRKVPSYEIKRPASPFETYEWMRSWHETIGKDSELFLLSLENDVIVPFAKTGKVITFAGGEEVSDYMDIIGDDNKKTEAWTQILPFLIQEGVTSLHLNNVPEDSSTLTFFKSHTSSVIKEEDTTPMMSLPPQLDKKYKHEMERKIRKFERENGNIELKEDHNIDVLLSLMKLDPRKKEFLTLEMEAFFQKIHSMGTITELLVGGAPAAAILAFRDGDTLMGYNSGFDETHFSGSGFYLKAMHIKRATESGVKTYNFLQGNERYKYELGGKDFFVYTVDTKI